MTARSAGELTSWRSRTQVRLYAYFFKSTVVFRARVNQSTFTYPITQVTFDTVTTGAYGDIKPWMTIAFSAYADDGADAGRTYARPDSSGVVATSTVLNVGRSSQGVREGELNLSDNYYITVWDHHKIWGVAPHNDMDPDNPTSYRWGSWAYDADDAFPPVVNMGPDTLVLVDEDTDTADIDFGQVACYVTNPAASSTLTYAWDFGDGTPSTSSSAAPSNVNFPVGARYVQLTVTDDQGTTNTGYRLVVVADRAHADLTKVAIVNHLQRGDGQEMMVRLLEGRDYSDYIDGAEVLIAQEEYYAGTKGSIGNISDRAHMVGTFYLDTESHTGEGSARGWKRNTRLRLIDAANRLKQLPGFPQVVARDAAPAVWEQMSGATIDRYVHFLLHWHSNVLTRHDFVWSGTNTSYPFTQLSSPGATLWEQANLRTQAIRHLLACDQHGVLRMAKDNIILPTSSQASGYSLPVSRSSTSTLQLAAADVAAIRWEYLYHPRGHWNWGSAVVASTLDADAVEDLSSVFCVSPGFAPGQGANSQDVGEQLVNATTPQAELNMVEGNRYTARQNAVVGNLVVELTRTGNIGVDPAIGEWITLPSSMQTTMRGRTIAGRMAQVIEIQWTYDHQKGTRTQSWGLEIEDTAGTPAVGYTPPDNTSNPGVIDIPDLPDPPGYPPNPGAGLTPNASDIGVFASNNYLYRTSTANRTQAAGGADWNDNVNIASLTNYPTSAGLIQAEFDPFGTTADGILLYNTHVQRITDAGAATPTLSTAYSFGNTSVIAAVATSRWLKDVVWVVRYVSGTGTVAYVSTDGGLNFNAYTVTSFQDTDANSVRCPGILIIPGANYMVTTAYKSNGTGTGATYGAFKVTTGGTVTEVSDIAPSGALAGCIMTHAGSPTGLNYYGRAQSGTRFEVARNTTEMGPIYSGTHYGVAKTTTAMHRIAVADDDPNTLIAIVANTYNVGGYYGVAYTRNAGSLSAPSATAWGWAETPVIIGTDLWQQVYLVNRNSGYALGQNTKAFGYWDGTTPDRIDNRTGNMGLTGTVAGLWGL